MAKNDCLAIALFYALAAVIVMAMSAWGAFYVVLWFEPQQDFYMRSIFLQSIYLTIASASEIVASVFLIAGVKKDRAGPLMAWMIVTTAWQVLQLAPVLFFVSLVEQWYHQVLCVVAVFVQLVAIDYSIRTVYKAHCRIQRERSRPPLPLPPAAELGFGASADAAAVVGPETKVPL